ncbi:MAG: AraC family transcriptional regulator [Bacteroidota bacterium]
MNNFKKYLTISEEEKKWGIYIDSIGKSHVKPHEIYPSKDHPTEYYFSWEEGRILDEYQIIYITKGKGIFENKFATLEIDEGSFVIVYPGQWHRYKPSEETGWMTNYIGFKGNIADHFISQLLVNKNKPVVHVGINEQFLECYDKIFEIIKKESHSYQSISTAIIIKLIGHINANIKNDDFNNNRLSEAINKIRYSLRENIDKDLNMQDLADEYNIGYSYFRKMFKKYTGMSPKQYHLQLKVIRAKELLLTSDKSVKEICFELGFQSSSYFSRMFKQKIGVTPAHFKEHKHFVEPQ